MMTHARRSLFAIAALPLLFACAHPQTEHARATNDSTFVLHAEADIEAIGAAYHERARLGLGGPFRLIEIAARDTRLPDDARRELMRELFERVADGDTYQSTNTLPAAHQHVIEHALTSARDPRVSELAINHAYDIAVAENTVSPETRYAASTTVALLRDRALAQRDAERVREHARLHDLDPATLVPALRAQRMLLVEQPLLSRMDQNARADAERLSKLVIGGVRQAARTTVSTIPQFHNSAIPREAAARILELQRTHERPPQSALIIAMRSAQLPYTARDEETFVAELALMPAHAQLAAQRAAIALRPFAQEKIWHAQSVAPGAKDMLVKYGVRIAFNDVPAQWQTYYRAQLDQALNDVQQVLPGLSLKGLTIEIGDVDHAANYLAFHDPRARSIRFAPNTGAGSLAHEIGHDVDWQIGRREYGRKRYASDYAADVAALMELSGPHATSSERKTETFARQFDWFIAAGLADLGRMNGMLTAVQNEWLPGHGGAVPPARTFAATIARSRPADQRADFLQDAPGLGRLGEVPVATNVARLAEIFGVPKSADEEDQNFFGARPGLQGRTHVPAGHARQPHIQ